ncbi:hypothetical protein [Synechococcus sp. UW179A]|uniref:hypothetical protein n=1 Tax=Synechococcus sp. UW179A TaxID=2575510 RepID=UPI000E0F9E19|nr:hypothetical protein [Synechococcus sp. UW179A]
MVMLSALIGVSLIFWFTVGFFSHVNWFQNAFRREAEKIDRQQIGSQSKSQILTGSGSLTAKKGFVLAYWDDINQAFSASGSDQAERSPVVFDIAAINLVAFTSICMLVFVSKGLFHSLGLT